MHRFKIRGARIALGIAASLCLFAGPALGDDRPWEQLAWHGLNTPLFASGLDRSSSQYALEFPPRTDEKHGFEFSRSLSLNFGKQHLFIVQGPLVAERASGLALEFRF